MWESNGWHVEGARLGMRGSVGGGWSTDGWWEGRSQWQGCEGAKWGMCRSKGGGAMVGMWKSDNRDVGGTMAVRGGGG